MLEKRNIIEKAPSFQKVHLLTKEEILQELKGKEIKNKIFLSVPLLRNRRIDGGICWAACGASLLDYWKIEENLTAGKLYTKLKKQMEKQPQGTIQGIVDMWKQYGLSVNYEAGRKNCKQIYELLCAKKPLLCILGQYQKREEEAKALYGHAVLLCGMYETIKETYYIYMDPNEAADQTYVINSIPEYTKDAADSTFYYQNFQKEEHTYNNWVGSFYK